MQFNFCNLSFYSYPCIKILLWIHLSFSLTTILRMIQGLMFPDVCCAKSLQLGLNLWTITHQAHRSMGFSRQEYWSGLLCPPPGDRPNLGIEPWSALQANSLTSEPPGKPNDSRYVSIKTTSCEFTQTSKILQIYYEGNNSFLTISIMACLIKKLFCTCTSNVL